MISRIKGKIQAYITLKKKITEGKEKYWTMLYVLLILCGKRFCEGSLNCAKWKQCWLGRSRWQLIGSGQTEKKNVPSKLIASATSVAAFLLEIFTWKPGLQAGVWNNFSLHWTLTSLQKAIKTTCITFLDANFPLSHTDLGALRVT